MTALWKVAGPPMAGIVGPATFLVHFGLGSLGHQIKSELLCAGNCPGFMT